MRVGRQSANRFRVQIQFEEQGTQPDGDQVPMIGHLIDHIAVQNGFIPALGRSRSYIRQAAASPAKARPAKVSIIILIQSI